MVSKKLLAVGIAACAALGLAAAIVLGSAGANHRTTIPAGTTFVAALERGVSTARSRPGDPVDLRVVEPIRIEGEDDVPPGAVLRGEVVEARSGGRLRGAPTLAIRFDRLEVEGEPYSISAEAFRVTGESDARRSATQIGAGAVAGGVLGGLLGGGDDAVKGLALGAVIGTGIAVATEGDQIVLPAGQKIRIRLADAVTVETD
jgi:hypothetical protein